MSLTMDASHRELDGPGSPCYLRSVSLRSLTCRPTPFQLCTESQLWLIQCLLKGDWGPYMHKGGALTYCVSSLAASKIINRVLVIMTPSRVGA